MTCSEASHPGAVQGRQRARWRWTGQTWSPSPGPRRSGTSDCADPEASWGHRKNNLLRSQDELFYGYYLSAGIMMREENGPAVPELARRATVSSCRHDPVRAFVPVLTAMPAAGIPLGDILDDSGYAHRDAGAWALPLRAAGAQLVQDLHPHDRGPKGTHDGAIIATATCTARSTPAPAAGTRAARPHRHQGAGRGPRPQDRRAGPLQARPPHRRRRRRLPPRAVPRRHGQDPLPAAASVDDAGPGPARDPPPPGAPPGLLRPADHHRPARTCSPRPRRNTTTRPRPGAAPTPAAPAPNAASPPPRTPPPTTSARGWCRLMGLAPLMLFTTTLLVARNQRILTAWNTRQEENASAAPPPGLPPRTRRTAPQDPRHARRRAAIGSAAHPATAAGNTHGTRPKAPGPATAAIRMPANQPRDTQSHRPDA